MEKQQFFRAATAGLGKYRTGGNGQIGVRRVNSQTWQIETDQCLPSPTSNQKSIYWRDLDAYRSKSQTL